VTTPATTSAQRPCAFCGEPYAPRFAEQRFCGDGCSHSAREARHLRRDTIAAVRDTLQGFAATLGGFHSQLALDVKRARERRQTQFEAELLALQAEVERVRRDTCWLLDAHRPAGEAPIMPIHTPRQRRKENR